MPHWTECSYANSPFIIPPTICVPIGFQPRYLIMRHNELASNKGVATMPISLNIRWRMSHWIAWMGDMCEEDRNGRGNDLLCVCACVCECVCLCESEFTGSCSSQWVFGSVDNRPHEKEMSYRHIQANTPLVCCSERCTHLQSWNCIFSLTNMITNYIIRNFSFVAAAGVSFSIN